jgi:DNA repair exonuclease SbcCD ATPase subunit
MAEYDALVLRLARHRVGRVLTIVAATWNEQSLGQRGYEGVDLATAVKLLNLRDEIKIQAENAASAVRVWRENQQNLAKYTGPGSEQSRTSLTESIRANERTLKESTETIRGLVADLKKLADELDPPGKKADAPAGEDPRFRRVRDLKEQIQRAENTQLRIDEVNGFLRAEEKKLTDLEGQRKLTADPKVNAELDRKITEARDRIAASKDEIAEERAALTRMTPVADLRKELDRVRQDIADSLKNGPEPAKKAGSEPGKQ